MSRTYHIFVPEWVPLQNKGEEAIVRGIADVLFPEGNCEIHLLDMVDEYCCQDGIHVYPVQWFVSPWMNREFGLGPSWEKIRDSACSLTRNGLHKIHPGWVKSLCAPMTKTARQITQLGTGKAPSSEKEKRLLQLIHCDYIIAGHDGALDERVCHVLDIMRESGAGFGIFGVELPTSFASRAVVEVLHSTLRHSQFFYSRTAASKEIAQHCFPDLNVGLLPDPAFGMHPASDEDIDKIIAGEGLQCFFSKPVVMCTCCEPAPIARYCFEDIGMPDLKLAAHRQLFAEMVQQIVRKYDVHILFLPHALGPGNALDDRIIARDILRRAQLPVEKARMLESPYSARELKGILKRSELLVAERIHSMIGATGVHRPFLCMGSRTDRRIRGIIENMLGRKEEVYFLNRPTLAGLMAKFDDVWNRRAALQKQLADVSALFINQLETAAAVMRKCIGVELQDLRSGRA
jgi:polysaccharide pyruvyl transferase WcaK-like protein